MGWFSNLFVNSDTVSKVVDAGISAGDKIWYTEEEKAEGRQKVREWYLDLLASMKPFNVAMRTLAMGVGAVWALHVLLSTSMYIAAFFLCDITVDSCSISLAAESVDSQMSKHINSHFSIIIMFYFGAAGVNSAISAAKGK